MSTIPGEQRVVCSSKKRGLLLPDGPKESGRQPPDDSTIIFRAFKTSVCEVVCDGLRPSGSTGSVGFLREGQAGRNALKTDPTRTSALRTFQEALRATIHMMWLIFEQTRCPCGRGKRSTGSKDSLRGDQRPCLASKPEL